MWPAPDAETTQLFLVRHGATDANERRPYILQGHGINFSLSDNGRQQARAVGQFLSKLASVKAIYCSELKRAMETAQEIAGHHNIPVQTVKGIHEVDVGDWEGKSWDTIMGENESAYHAFMSDPGDTPYLNGESYRDVLNRVKPALTELLKTHRGETIVVVAHNVVNRAYLADVLGLELRRAKDIRQANCCVNVIHHKQDKAELESLNSQFHLHKLASSE
ncbi:MAG: histidine phosphatase family protein [Planctomycetaceae bacterium]|nr:histidine phosphatase family protein [Planctomycetaceae bacterium]